MSHGPARRAAVRIIVGLLQGLALCLLHQSIRTHGWPASQPVVYTPLVLVIAIVPLIILFGFGDLRMRTLLAWAGGATVILAALGAYDRVRVALDQASISTATGAGPVLIGFTLIGVFIAQSLITGSDSSPRWIASYPDYFAAAWKLELQILLTAMFAGLFWLLLWLGAELLQLIHVTFLHSLITDAWFAYPATTLAIATAIHLTDVRASIIAGIRSLIHIVLSWLLPLIALIVGIFLLSLPFTGLRPLWQTSHAATLLLTVAAVTVVLINTVYRDGTSDQAAPRLLRFGASLAVVELAPIVGIAAFAIGLRVGQYGWTVDRVFAAAATVVATCYSLGYALAVIRRGPWLRGLEVTNIAVSFVILAAFLTLLTPLGDPARIAVASQIALLKSGRIAPNRFDYAYLSAHGERYGRDALTRLKTDTGNDASIRDGADSALGGQHTLLDKFGTPTEADLARTITVYPPGRSLPDAFLRWNWRERNYSPLPLCLTNKAFKCEAFLIDLDGDGADEIILAVTPRGNGAVFKSDKDGNWSVAGSLSSDFGCDGVLDALRAGRYSLSASPWKDIVVAGETVRVGGLPGAPHCH